MIMAMHNNSISKTQIQSMKKIIQRHAVISRSRKHKQQKGKQSRGLEGVRKTEGSEGVLGRGEEGGGGGERERNR